MERLDKIKSNIKEVCAQYLNNYSNGTSLITLTDIVVTPDVRQATLFISVFPPEGEESALNFAKRHRPDMRDFLKKNMKTKTIPFLDIKIDQGEKNRQKIDDLLREAEKNTKPE